MPFSGSSAPFKRKTSTICELVVNEGPMHILPMKMPKDASIDSGVSLSSSSSLDES